MSDNQNSKKNESVKRPYALGIALIILGMFFISERLGLIEFSWPLILIILGASFITEAIVHKRSTNVFPGSFLLLLGIIFLADQEHWVSGGVASNWPLVFIALGVSFISIFIFNPDKRGALIPGGIMIAFGLLFLFAEYRVIRWRIVANILEWWPIGLMGLGAWLIFRKR